MTLLVFFRRKSLATQGRNLPFVAFMYIGNKAKKRLRGGVQEL